MNKKIAIMTWHYYNNYGGVLQSYALRKKILNIGYQNVDLIDYRSKYRTELFYKKLFSKAFLRDILNHFYHTSKFSERDMKFDEFRNKSLSFTKKCNNKIDLYSLNTEYDKFICGSDQIWAPTVFDENYFLGFVKNDSKKISYAPSIGLNEITDKNVEKLISGLVSKIPCLSIREEKGKKIINKISGRNAKIVLDPTLLLSKEEWNKEFKLDNFDKKNYILVYCLGDVQKAYKIAKRFNKKIIILPKDSLDYKKYKENSYFASPIEFLKLIYNADMVITDSFHGTIFSMNFNVPFIVIKRFKDNLLSQNSRIYNILKITNTENRLYNNNLDILLKENTTDFEKINRIFEEKRKESIQFLIESIESKNEEEQDEKITNVCTGCGVCSSVCPKKCIEIKLNDNGFYEYKKDKDKCIDCGFCKKVCGQVVSKDISFINQKLYSFYSKSKEVLQNSSSGGAAYEISKYALENDYKIIGCIYDYENKIARHIVVDNENDIKKFSGSKYIQSYTEDAFKKILDLDKALIIGTPCQIASIDNYLRLANKRENFILVDLICHGVPSYHLWNRYLETRENKEEVRFRDKRFGWRVKTITVDGKKYEKEGKSLFYDFFLQGNIYNESCYECKYRASSSADIRIGDYWGPKFKNNNKGVSMIITCTELGENVIKKLNQSTCILEDINDYYKYQQIENTLIPVERNLILSNLKDNKISLKEISNRYCRKYKIDKKIYNIFRTTYKKVKSIIKFCIKEK